MRQERWPQAALGGAMRPCGLLGHIPGGSRACLLVATSPPIRCPSTPLPALAGLARPGLPSRWSGATPASAASVSPAPRAWGP